jgi:hypothetical protein
MFLNEIKIKNGQDDTILNLSQFTFIVGDENFRIDLNENSNSELNSYGISLQRLGLFVYNNRRCEKLYNMIPTSYESATEWFSLYKEIYPNDELVNYGSYNIVGTSFSCEYLFGGYCVSQIISFLFDCSRFCKSNGNSIVLIEYPERYMRPKEQIAFMNVLRKHFSNNHQFIITTESPYVLGCVPYGEYKIYKTDDNSDLYEFDYFNTYGASVDRIMTYVLDLPMRCIPDVEEKINLLSKLIEENKLDDAKKMLLEDFNDIDRDDPVLGGKRTLLKTKEILAKS